MCAWCAVAAGAVSTDRPSERFSQSIFNPDHRERDLDEETEGDGYFDPFAYVRPFMPGGGIPGTQGIPGVGPGAVAGAGAFPTFPIPPGGQSVSSFQGASAGQTSTSNGGTSMSSGGTMVCDGMGCRSTHMECKDGHCSQQTSVPAPTTPLAVATPS